jgi:hypothetical protein
VHQLLALGVAGGRHDELGGLGALRVDRQLGGLDVDVPSRGLVPAGEGDRVGRLGVVVHGDGERRRLAGVDLERAGREGQRDPAGLVLEGREPVVGSVPGIDREVGGFGAVVLVGVGEAGLVGSGRVVEHRLTVGHVRGRVEVGQRVVSPRIADVGLGHAHRDDVRLRVDVPEEVVLPRVALVELVAGLRGAAVVGSREARHGVVVALPDREVGPDLDERRGDLELLGEVRDLDVHDERVLGLAVDPGLQDVGRALLVVGNLLVGQIRGLVLQGLVPGDVARSGTLLGSLDVHQVLGVHVTALVVDLGHGLRTCQGRLSHEQHSDQEG